MVVKVGEREQQHCEDVVEPQGGVGGAPAGDVEPRMRRVRV